MENTPTIQKVSIEKELKKAYLDYSMSVIVGRALPDVRDGLKPVHRRVLYAMHVLNNDWNKAFKKSARIVGDVIGKYHPHGDSAVYDTIVRMAQDFAMRYTLVDGQGNFGSIDGDSPAAMRYTEIRMQKITHHMLEDIDKETVDFIPNYDESETLPDILPTRVPGLLINGSIGIAVGMATNIPPHNLTEVISGCLAIMENPDISIEELMEYIPGPDFPTRGIINGRQGIIDAYNTGRGIIYIRGRYHIEDQSNDKQAIIVTEIPYQVNKSKLIERIAELVRDKKLTGISELRDESDKDGMRIYIELKRNEIPEVIVNNLYKFTDLEVSFGFNMVVLDQRQPKLMNIKDIIKAFLAHRHEIVTRRTIYLLRKARERGHILEGLALALSNLNEVIELIRNANNPAEAKEQLLGRAWPAAMVLEMLANKDQSLCRPEDLEDQYGFTSDGYLLSPNQAQGILDLRLHRLTGLERDKLFGEFQEIVNRIIDLIDILNKPERLTQIVSDELKAVSEEFGDERKSEILESKRNLTTMDLMAEEQVVVTITKSGYAKLQPLADYKAQRRGGRGKTATKLKEEDQIQSLLTLSNLDTILCFSNKGKVYWLKVFEIPQSSRNAKGRPLVNLLPLEEDEHISTLLPLPESNKADKKHKHDFGDAFIFMATRGGMVKKTELSKFARPRSTGLIALTLLEGDSLIKTSIISGNPHMMLVADNGFAIRFRASDVRESGRTSQGVRGIRIGKNDSVIAMQQAEDDDVLLCASVNGYGKRTKISEFRPQSRGGKGLIAMQLSERNGKLIAATQVTDENELILITNLGTLVRVPASQISTIGRNTQGVRLIKLSNEETLVSLDKIDLSEAEDIEEVEETDVSTE